jgi:SAM-dependent methyltransferase
MICRMCGSASTTKIGEVQYYIGFKTPVYDCDGCGGRFCEHVSGIHERMHLDSGTYYNAHVERARRCKAMVDAKDLAGLRQELISNSSRYHFTIRSVESLPKSARLLEIGCSRGYLTSYFILAGYDTLGVDISTSAIESAKQSFGPYFVVADSSVIAERAPFDVIYHVGTIGCVSDPLALTRALLAVLKPGGKLLFNATNVDACILPGQLWIDWGPPPDLVSLFKPGMWTRLFSDQAYVTEEVETYPLEYSIHIAFQKLAGQQWRAPEPIRIGEGLPIRDHANGTGRSNGRLRSFTENMALKISRKLHLSQMIPLQATEFGLLVTMTKK